MSRIQIKIPDDRWIRGDWEGVTPKNGDECVVTKLSGSGEKPGCKGKIARYIAKYDQFQDLFGDGAWRRKDVSFWYPINPGTEILLREEEQVNTLEAELGRHGFDRNLTAKEAIEILRDTPIDIRSTRDDGIHTLYATAQMMAIDALREIQQYREIGTVEECKEAAEKQKAKKPNYEGDGYDDKGELMYDTWICPNCGERYEVDYDDYEYCPKCGQALRWNRHEH